MSEDVNNNPEQEELNNIVVLNDENGPWEAGPVPYPGACNEEPCGNNWDCAACWACKTIGICGEGW